MLGSTPITAILGCGVDSTDHDAMRAFVRAATSEGLSLLLVLPGTKQPADMRTPRQRSAADKRAREAAKDEGRRDWDKVRSPSGLALASNEQKVVLGYLDRYCKVFSTWTEIDTDDPQIVAYDEKREKAGEIAIAEPVAVNLAVEVGGSGIVVVDCDTREQLVKFLEVSQAPLDMPPTVRSPGQTNAEGTWVHKDGGHFWFTVPDELIPVLPRNSGALTWGGDHGFAVLWDRRYVLIPPSTRPEGAYELTGDDYPLPDWLADEIMAHGQRRAERSRGNREAFAAGDGALSESIDAWAETVSWADILEPLGWAPAPRSDGCGCPVWSAPGEHASPKSATAHDPGCSLGRYTEVNCPLHIWTDNPGDPFDRWLAEEKTATISKLQAVALVDYNNSIGKAMDALGLAPDLGVGADFGVGPAGGIDAGDDVSVANMRAEWPEQDALDETAITKAEHAAIVDEKAADADLSAGGEHCWPCNSWEGLFVVDPDDGQLYHAVDDDDAGEGGHLAHPEGVQPNGSYHFSAPAEQTIEIVEDADPFDIAGAQPSRPKTERPAREKTADSPFADEVDEPHPDVFDSAISGVPRIAPFTHWRDLPPPEYVIDGLIEHGGLACMIGPPGVGKSTLALDMACHVAMGRRWQGRQTLKTKVMYMPGEGLSGAIQRIIAWCDAYGVDEADVSENLLLADAILQLGASNEAWAEFGAYVARQQVGVIIFDTFARMSLRLEENSATDVGLAVARFDRVRQLTNAGVIIVHHTAKGQDFARGSSALNGAMDSELLVKYGEWDTSGLADANGRLPGKPIQLSTSKQKNAEQLDEPMPLLLRSWRMSEDRSAALITGPNGEVDPTAGDIVLARPVAEPLVETAIRIREFVDGLTQQGASRSELVLAIKPDPYALSRADTATYWRIRVTQAVDRALHYQLIETLTGTPSGGRYIPCQLGTPASARQQAADEVINGD